MKLLQKFTSDGEPLPKEVWVMALNNLCIAIGFGVMIPVLPEFARQFKVDNFRISWVVSGFAMMRLITSPFSGVVIRKLGERTVLGVGIFFVAASTTAAGFSTSFAQLVIFRGVGGVGSALFSVAALSLLLRVTPAHQRGRSMGLYNTGFLLGAMLGPAVGGVVSAISLSAPFFFYAITLVISGTFILTLIREPQAKATTLNTVKKPNTLTQVFADVRYQTACLTGFGQGWQAFGVRNALVPVLVTTQLALKPTWTGMAFAAAAVAQTIVLPLSGKLTDTWGRRPIVLLGCFISAGASALFPYSTSIWMLIAALCVFAIGGACLSTAPPAAMADAVGDSGRTPIAISSMVTDLGVIIGPLVAGWLADHHGMPIAFASGAILLATLGLFALRMPPGAPQATSDGEEARDILTSEVLEEEKAG